MSALVSCPTCTAPSARRQPLGVDAVACEHPTATVGVLMLVVGYLAPLPPKATRPEVGGDNMATA